MVNWVQVSSIAIRMASCTLIIFSTTLPEIILMTQLTEAIPIQISSGQHIPGEHTSPNGMTAGILVIGSY